MGCSKEGHGEGSRGEVTSWVDLSTAFVKLMPQFLIHKLVSTQFVIMGGFILRLRGDAITIFQNG